MLTRLAFFLGMAALPSILLLLFFYRRDNQKPEPTSAVVKLFIFGCISILPAFLLEKLMMRLEPWIPTNWHPFFQAFAVAALVEEGIKFFLVKKISRRLASFDEITDGIVYTIAAGLGFAFLENVSYGMAAQGSIFLLIARGVTAVPLHCLASGLMGYSIGLAWQNPRRSGVGGLLLAILVHGLYDWILFSPSIANGWIFLIFPPGYLLLFQFIKWAKKKDRELGLS